MDEASFDAFYTASFSRVVAATYAMCGNMAEAQDCTQEAFIRAWDRRAQLRMEDHPEAWVRTVAHRLAISRWRRARRALRPPDRAVETPQAPTPTPTRVALDHALAQLTSDQRQAIVLYHLCDMSVGDIATLMGAPTGTVKARLSRGRAALASIMGDREETLHD